MAVDPFLPGDLLSDILNRVSLKTVLRCICVCKSWYSFITSPRFINTCNLLDNTDEKQVIVWRHCNDGDKFYIHKDNDTFDRILGFNSPFRYPVTRIVSSCNGLICICVKTSKSRRQNVFLFNPIIRRFSLVPRNSTWETIGFGFDSATNNYKVVNICSTDLRRTVVFELSTRSWRSLEESKDFLINYDIAADSPQCFLNDRIHWDGRELSGDFRLTILTFDMINDEFGVFQVPSDVIDELQSDVHPMLFQESLALVQIGLCNNFIVWVMHEYGVEDSWIKHFTISLDFKYSDKLLGFRQNGDALLAILRPSIWNWDSNHALRELIISYEPKCEKFDILIETTVDRYRPNYIPQIDIMYADYCLPSLVLLDGLT